MRLSAKTLVGGFALAWLVVATGCVIDTVPLPELNGGTGGRDSGDGASGGTPNGGSGGSGGTGGTGGQGGQAGGGNSGSGGSGGAGGSGTENPDATGAFDNASGSNVYWADEAGFVFVVGTEAAFPGAGTVVIINPVRGDQYEASSSSDGSYAAMINARLFDILDVSFEAGGHVVASTSIALVPGSVDAYGAGTSLAAALPSLDSTSLTSVSVTRSGAATVLAGPPATLRQGLIVVVANPRKNLATRAVVDSQGGFSAIIGSAPGDMIVLFAVEPASSNGGGALLRLTAP